MSKSLDNRLGVATLIELLKVSYPNIDLCAAFTVQEEIGLRGAKVAAQYFKPDLAIVIDATPANDLPMQFEGENIFYNTKLGLGPAIYVSNSSTIDDPRLVRFIQSVATEGKDILSNPPAGWRRDGCGRHSTCGCRCAGCFHFCSASLHSFRDERGSH